MSSDETKSGNRTLGVCSFVSKSLHIVMPNPHEGSQNARRAGGLKKDDYEILVMAGCAIGLSILYNLLQESMFTSDAKKYT
eukprot:1354533-Amorphochlora_amoeboformis.AAC.3